MSVSVVSYKKKTGCPACTTLDKILPRLKAKYPEVQWYEIVVESEDDLLKLPAHVRSFPTSLIFVNGEEAEIVVGYAQFATELDKIVNG